MTGELAKKRCVPCEGGVPPLSSAAAREYLREVSHWTLSGDGKRISREWTFRDFPEAMAFVNRVASLAEEEQHHPDIRVFSYRRVRLDLSTHAIGGLSENDFILAAKADALAGAGVRAVQGGGVPT